MKNDISIVWFRQDLRISDNPALLEASQVGTILPIYILDDCAPKPFKIGNATKVWLHHSVDKLNQSLDEKLNIYEGDSSAIISELLKTYNITHVFWNSCYEPWHIEQENKIKSTLDKNEIHYTEFNSNYLWRPDHIMKEDESYYKVFTAYKKKSYTISSRKVVATAKKLILLKDTQNKTNLKSLDLIPQNEWYTKIEAIWEIGEHAAHSKLHNFIEHKLSGYKLGRNYPNQDHTSILSPHLHFGEISPAQIKEAVTTSANLYTNESDIEHFVSEVIWREFSCYLMYHFKKIHTDNVRPEFNHFHWKRDKKLLNAWQTGHTGYPLVDAGMRQLWQTGYMHNRVRMVVASFLVKNLNIHWHDGRDWFWDCLVDADLGNNSASWQWVAGCGVDAAPYFRIFNPVLQSQKFDPQGEYIKQWVPELKNVPAKWIHEPSMAPAGKLGLCLGKEYPHPIIDHDETRKTALKMYASLKKQITE